MSAEKGKETNLEETQSSSGNVTDLSKNVDSSKNKNSSTKNPWTDQHGFLLRRNFLRLVCTIKDGDSDAIKKLKNEIKKYCEMASKEYENNNFDTALQHLSQAENFHSQLLEENNNILKTRFLKKKSALMLKLSEVDSTETEAIEKLKDEIKKYCDKATEQCENNNLNAAQLHLLQAECISETLSRLRKEQSGATNNKGDAKIDKVNPESEKPSTTLHKNKEVKTGIVKEENLGDKSKGAESLFQPNRGYFSNNQSKHTNLKKDTLNVHSVAEARSVNEVTNTFPDALLAGDNKTPLNVLKAEPVRSDKDQKVNTTVSGPSVVTTQHENVCNQNKTPTSHDSVPKPMANVSKNNEKKNTEAATTKKITTKPDRKLSEARNVKDNNGPILINKNLAQNNESKNEESEKDAATLMNIARDYLKKGNLVEAERYLIKALEIQPCATAAKVLRQVQALTGYNCYARYVNPEAENCFKEAKLAFSSQNLDKAEQLLLKAEELCPQPRQKALLANVRLAKVAEKNKRESMLLLSPATDPQPNDRSPHFPKIRNFKFNFTFTNLAGSSALQKPNVLKKSEIAAGIPTRADRCEVTGHPNAPTPTTSVKVNKVEPVNCSKKAKDAVTPQNYNPEQHPPKSQTLPSVSDNRDSTTINNEITKTGGSLNTGDHIAVSQDENSVEPSYQYGRRACVYTMSAQDVADLEAAEQCLRKAEMALDNGELEKAQRWAERAQRMRASKRGAELLRRMDEAKRRIAIDRANTATNDYARLGLKRQATLAEVKTAYRKLTLLLHADKTHAPEAKEAFMIVTDAYKKLSKKLKTRSE